MSNSAYSLSDLIIDNLFNMGRLLSRPYEIPYQLARKQWQVSHGHYGQAISRLRDRKLLMVTERNNNKFIKLTKKGQLEVLLMKAKPTDQKSWDGKWRLFMFDIPERSKEKRNVLRSLLKKNNFCKLQASVYVSPYALNREAVAYLNQSGLRAYIRILKVEEMDSDEELLRKFSLKKAKSH